MKRVFLYLFLASFPLSGCSKKKDTVATFSLKRADFIEKIDATGTIQAVNTFSIVAPRVNVSSMTVTYLIEEGRYVKKGDTLCILSAPDLISIYESTALNNETLKADLKKLEATNKLEKSLLEAKFETNKARMSISMLDSVQRKFAPPVKQQLISLELEKVKIEQSKLSKQLEAQKRIDASELASLRSRIIMDENRLHMFSDQIKLLAILAPSDGMIMHVESPVMMFFSTSGLGTLGGKIKEGSSVWSNMVLLQIPNLNEMQVSVEVPEADYKRIDKGQKVNIRPDAVMNLLTTGVVKRKTLVGKKNQRETAIKTYEVIVSVDSCHSRMMPGLSARCEILINKIKDTLSVPTISIFEKDSSKIVYVAAREDFVPVTIGTGLSNSSETLVTKGLNGNETIALVEPPHNLIKKRNHSPADQEKKNQNPVKDSVVNGISVK